MLKIAILSRKLLPKGLLGRALLILLMPLIFLQAVLGYVFYEYHIEDKLINSARRVASEISYIRTIYEKHTQTESFLNDFSLSLGHQYILINKNFAFFSFCQIHSAPLSLMDIIADKFIKFLSSYEPEAKLCFYRNEPLSAEIYFIMMHLSGDKYLGLKIHKKEIISSKWHFLPVWSLATAFVSALIAIIFLKNQIRPIIRLSQVLEAFGRGDNDCSFHPSGAVEIRKAGIEFLKMRRRLKEYIASRTMMLAGVSHDLRTILTRFKLELSLMPPDESTQNLKTDVDHMTAVLDAYFNFINTTVSEETTLINITQEIQALVGRHQQSKHKITITSTIDTDVMLRKNGFFRCMLNLLSNAQRYGDQIHITLAIRTNKQGKFIESIIEDNGIGVIETHYEKIFDPFFSDNLSRTLSHNHGERIGLGLSIARNIARTKGGDIIPDYSERLGGLKMTLIYAIDT